MKKLLPLLARLVLLAVLLMGGFASFSQGKGNSGKKPVPQAALDHLNKNKQKLGLEDGDIADLALSSETQSKKSGVKHLYLQQQYQGIEIHNALTNISMTSDGQVVNMGNRFEKGVSKKVKTKGAKITAEAAVAAAAKHLNISVKEPLSVKTKEGGANEKVLFSKGGISIEPIPAKLVYQPMEDGSLRLAWQVSIYELDARNWWNIRVDAATGEFLDKDNMVSECNFENDGPNGVPLQDNHAHGQVIESKSFNFATAVVKTTAANSYNVFAMPFESPSHGDRSMVLATAADKNASPAGWQTAGAQSYTITRGNNVHAYEDPDNIGYAYGDPNFPATIGYSPDGGAALSFDFPIDFTKQPVVYRDAAITNLFYWNNLIHDVWYPYGFDEESGSFQVDNFGKDGDGNDPVMAEAQDSRNIPTTRNNANFGTPPDGISPRMQMYLWSGKPDANQFTVTSPANIARAYPALEATWSKKLTSTPVTGKLVVAQTAAVNSAEGCSAFTNAEAIKGNIAVVYRGTCGFAIKGEFAQAAGAIGLIVINNQPGVITMGGVPTPGVTINIPALMISDTDGKLIRDVLDTNTDVTVSLKNDGAGPEFDGDFDNGIIAHEYGHGISNRLTGGPDVTNCLPSAVISNGVVVNTEQMGEGWSDYVGLMMTIKQGDTRVKVRGIGTYASGQPTTGLGIRPAPYSTDFAVNNFTYAQTNNSAISAPHGVGFVWATMLWDMTWDLIDKYGYDQDLYNGKGGNNMSMQLVIDGMKLQPCRPGFVDGRDAILLADRINYGGANQELIWKAFAKRGLGFSAKQGSSVSRFDQVQAFDLPPTYLCTAPLTVAAVPTSDVYTYGEAKVVYLGYETVMLQASGDATNKYTWTPATGLSDATIANPVFTPTAAGDYTFTVKAVNQDQCTKTESITVKVIDVRCGNKGNKVQVCFKGKEMCVDAADANALLTREGGEATLGTCTPKAKAAVASLTAADALNVNDGLTASPNPTNAKTNLGFTLPQSGAYRLEVMNMQGSVVAVVAEGQGEAGQRFTHEFSKGRLAAGVYIVRLAAGKQNKFTRIILQD